MTEVAGNPIRASFAPLRYSERTQTQCPSAYYQVPLTSIDGQQLIASGSRLLNVRNIKEW